ncbi:MAG: N-acetylmuramoyl-L-alanine amidase, partial [Muribaculaceae bacterium]|nr:N-acetylmuramoyl-L-alanine amidase [Muribaculaceae bacterium]
ESYIIFEMAQKKNLEQSLKFANFAQKQLVNKAGRKDRGVKQAGFWVLWATSMPAVLVELDFICNPTSAAFMGSTEGEKKMAEALSNAVVQYYNSIRPSLGEKRVSLNSTKKENKPPVSQRYLAASESKNSVSSTRTAVSQKKSEADSENSKGELAVVTKSKRNDIPPKYNSTQENGRRTTTARKRRSASSKVASDRRNVETSSIVVKSENDYMAKVNEKKPAVKQEKKEVIKETPKERKKRLALEKKRKDKELKEKEALRKKEAKAREQQAKKEKENKEVQ